MEWILNHWPILAGLTGVTSLSGAALALFIRARANRTLWKRSGRPSAPSRGST